MANLFSFGGDLTFFDVETTIPDAEEHRYFVIEFGAIVLDKVGLYERESYGALIKASHITKRSRAANGISDVMLQHAPPFAEVADRIFGLLNGRVWVGHNIIRFDNKRIEEEFLRLGRDPPKPLAVVDTLDLLKKTFGTRAGDLKMATLGRYFGLGEERHRALDDCRMTIEVVKKCATILYFEQFAGLAPPVPTESSSTSKPTAATSDTSSPSEASGEKPPASKRRGRPRNTSPSSSDSPPKASPQILEHINEAISLHKPIWIIYQSGSPRKMIPIKWARPNDMFVAMCLRNEEPTEKNFLAAKVIEIRDEEWTVEAPPPAASHQPPSTEPAALNQSAPEQASEPPTKPVVDNTPSDPAAMDTSEMPNKLAEEQHAEVGVDLDEKAAASEEETLLAPEGKEPLVPEAGPEEPKVEREVAPELAVSAPLRATQQPQQQQQPKVAVVTGEKIENPSCSTS